MRKMKLRLFSLLLAAAVCFGAAVPVAASEAGVASVLFGSIPYYGDPSACRMTAGQADTMAELIESLIAERRSEYIDYGKDYYFGCFAALFDTGAGVPALAFAGGSALGENYIDAGGDWGVWQLIGGNVTRCDVNFVSIFDDHLFSNDFVLSDAVGNATYSVYTYANGVISTVPSTTAGYSDFGKAYMIDDRQTGKAEYDAWMNKWSVGPNVGLYVPGGPGVRFDGLGSAETVAAALRSYAAAERGGAAALLETLPYYGDRSKCKMRYEQAEAFAEVLANRYHEGPLSNNADRTIYNIHAALCDVENNGSPILVLHYNISVPMGDWAGEHIEILYSWSDNQINEVGGFRSATYGTAASENYVAFGKNAFGGYSWSEWRREMAGARQYNTISMVIDGAIQTTEIMTDYDIDNEVTLLYVDGILQGVTDDDIDEFLNQSGAPQSEIESHFIKCDIGMPQAAMTAALRAYAEMTKVPAYAYPQAEEGGARYREVAEAVSGRGTVRSVYELLEDLYYVLLENQGTYSGALVRGVTRNGKPVWEVSEVNEEPAEESALEALVSRLLSSPNLTPDFSKLRGTPEAEELRDYLEDLLANYDGLSPNDAALTELAAFLDSAVSAAVADSVRGKDNRLTLDKKLVSDLAEGAVSVWEELLGALEERGVALNKTVTPRARLLWKDFDADKACQITVKKSLVSGLKGADLQLLLGGGERYIQLSYENLRRLIDELGGFSIQFSRTGENQYGINFLDEDGDVLDSLPSPVILGLPAASMTSTVMASYTGGSDNWGGQYDETAGVLAFETRYSGQYEVMENSVQIADIADLSEEAQTAIRFLVSKGYLSLDENGLFNPWQPLTRYDFTRTLVSMFFALDRSLSAPFADVPEESEYYAYVASAKANGLVQGVTETSFEGEQNLSVEQMLTVTGRTLAERKGYAVPEDAGVYLSVFTDGGAVSEWAREHTALSVREGLKDRGGMLEPQGSITREQAAVALYRLFLRLYEVPPVALDLPPESEEAPEEEKEDGVSESGEEPGNGTVILIASAAGAAVLAGAAAAVIILKKRKTTAGK